MASPFAYLQVEILIKLRGVGNFAHFKALFSLQSDEIFDQMLREHAASGQVVVVGFQRIKGILQSGGKAGELGLFFLG